jgi:TRAP-type mannitol/chloroaromatic compound transport system substrate-binding protein
MISPVSNASHVQPQAAVQAAATRQPAQAATPKAAVTDTVQISNAAKILQEATETPAQTAKEAGSGDLQAKALLARETADRGGTK